MGKLYHFVMALVAMAICGVLVCLGVGMIVVGLMGVVNPAGSIVLVGCGVLVVSGIVVGTDN